MGPPTSALSARQPPLHARVREMLRAIPPSDMPREHRTTLLALAGFDGPRGICPSREALEETFGVSESTIKTELRDLEAARRIRVDRSRKTEEGRQAPNGYQINVGGRWLPGDEEALEPLPVVRLRDRSGTWEAVARGARKQPPQKSGEHEEGAQATPSSRGARAHLRGGRAGAPDIDLDIQEIRSPLPPEPEPPPAPPVTPPTAPRSGGPSGGSGQEQLFGAEQGRAAARVANGVSTAKSKTGDSRNRLAEEYAAGMSDAAGSPFPVPEPDGAPFPRPKRGRADSLMVIADTYAKDLRGADLYAWFRKLAADFRRAIPPERIAYHRDGYSPAGCRRWLESGRPVEGDARARGEPDEPPIRHVPRAEAPRPLFATDRSSA